MLIQFVASLYLTTASFFLPLVAQDTAQQVITLYDFRPTTTGPNAGQITDVLNVVHDNAKIVGITPVAVDKAGLTVYRAVQERTVIPSAAGEGLTTVIIPTPTTDTFTFRADATRYYYGSNTIYPAQGGSIDVLVSYNCVHNVDDDTPPANGGIVCNQDGLVKVVKNGKESESFLQATATGIPLGIWTLTVDPNITLPTVEAVFRGGASRMYGVDYVGDFVGPIHIVVLVGLIASAQLIL